MPLASYAQRALETAVALCELSRPPGSEFRTTFEYYAPDMTASIQPYLDRLEEAFEAPELPASFRIHDFYQKLRRQTYDGNPGILLKALLEESRKVDKQGSLNVLFAIALAICKRGPWIDEPVLTQSDHRKLLCDLFSQVRSLPSVPVDLDALWRLQDLAYTIVGLLLKPMAQNFSAITTASESPSIPPYDANNGATRPSLQQADHRRNQRRERILMRDDFCCSVTKRRMVVRTGRERRAPEYAFRSGPETQRTLLVQGGGVLLEIGHIIPHSFNAFNSPDDSRANVWSILNLISPRLSDILSGYDINSETNLITLSRSIHGMFGALNLGLEPVEGRLNKYKVVCYEALPINFEHPDVEFHGESVFVTLRDHSQGQVNLPNPLFLQVHCACVRIKHLSGHADIIDDLVQEEEDGIVAWDGSTNLGSLVAARLASVSS